LARAYFNSAGHSLARGELAAARRYANHGVAITERTQVPWVALVCRAEVAFICGDWNEARIDAHQAIQAAQALNPNSTYEPALGLERLIELLRADQTEKATAASNLVEALARFKRHFSIDHHRAWVASVLAERDLLAQRPVAALAHLGPLSQHVGRPDDVGQWITTPLVWACLALGQREEARQRAEDGVARARARRYQLYLIDALRARALVAMDRSAWEEARDDLDDTMALCQVLPYPYAEAKALWVYGQLEVARGGPVAARERFTAALAICAKLGERLYAERIERDLAVLPA
jgi:tetratricopeptide (TPR) repeat protein